MPDHESPPPDRIRRLSSETIELLSNRRSIRKFEAREIPADLIEAILRASFRAPTSSNIQSYGVIVVRDSETKRRLSIVTGNQRHVADAPVFLAFCADLRRIEYAMNGRGHTMDGNNLETCLVSSIDASLVGMSAYLAAESLGLGGVMIGGVRNDALGVARILGLPPRVYCVFGMCLGWPAEMPPQKPRMPFGSMVHRERYGATLDATDTATLLADYDRDLSAHYRSTGRPTTDDSWTHDMDKKFHPWLRDTLRQDLRSLGFEFR
jgi:nitroreductase